MNDLDSTVALLGDLIAFPTVSADSNLAMIEHLAERLEAAGARTSVLKDDSGRKANLFATLGPDRAEGGLILSGHSDVVPVEGQDWHRPPFEMTEDDAGRLYGRGTCDMKGFIAAAVHLAPELARIATHRPVHFSFTYDEEVGCLGARSLTSELAKRGLKPAMTMIGEPTEMRVIDGHKGVSEYTVRFHGRAGHGSDPDAGASALDAAIRYAARLLELREELKRRAADGLPFHPPWTTVNLGRLSGGNAHNVIAASALLEWEMRPAQAGDAEFVREALSKHVEEVLLPQLRRTEPDARIETEVIGDVVGLDPENDNALRDLLLALTGTADAGTVAFGTEAGLFRELGGDVVVCGPGSISQAHLPDEFVTRDQLDHCLRTIRGLTQRVAGTA
ncbi:acetylornithine deacetylase [Roseicyclus sp. F158]|uniref:Acetylornithine deacetylase n=1 Tax=Tropicimonas omnivorans TaxID=3075590 RepID=A0ABU3DF54_9RHOB|nr:acetylornithine deacetylase [Roseicyclus sp. F158]MDT0682346.1 acetylornithine deacetylase [Roseicyclus sp. F158]